MNRNLQLIFEVSELQYPQYLLKNHYYLFFILQSGFLKTLMLDLL